ncbi:unnamed protein product, partial [Nesidiocoris tenuis]
MLEIQRFSLPAFQELQRFHRPGFQGLSPAMAQRLLIKEVILAQDLEPQPGTRLSPGTQAVQYSARPCSKVWNWDVIPGSIWPS